LAEHGDASRYDLPRPMLNRPGLDFSFSGLKTAVMLKVREAAAADAGIDDATRADLAASFQEAVVDALVGKCLRAIDATGRDRLVVAGGVGANRRLRDRLQAGMAAAGGRVYYPRIEFCTDNGAMIAYTGWLRLRAGGVPDDAAVHARARWDLREVDKWGGGACRP
jgi:N6-L-threonylcarbamoyladenine synthase